MDDLWTCPRCGRRFVTRNRPHSCGPWSVEAVLSQASPEVRALYDGFARRALAAGEEAVVAPTRTRIGFQRRTIFAAVTPRKRWLDAHVVLERRLEHPRFRRIETFSPTAHLHAFRVSESTELDDELAGWLREAYEGFGRGHGSASRPAAARTAAKIRP